LRNKERVEVYRIYGAHDLIPPRPNKDTYLLEGGYLVIIDQAQEIFKMINIITKKAVKEDP